MAQLALRQTREGMQGESGQIKSFLAEIDDLGA